MQKPRRNRFITTRQTTSARNTDYTFDEESRITGITFPNSTTSSYSYNGLDTRVSKSENSTTTNYRRMGAGVTAPVLSDGTNNFTPGISSRASSVSTWDFAGIKSNDSQVNSSGTVAATKTYDAFGNVVSNSGTWQGSFGYGGDYGYQSDDVSGLKLLGHRYYDSSIGRFLTRDPIQDGRNWYGYCENNPLSYADPDGLKPGDKYKTADEAAIAAIEDINGKSIAESVEYAGWVYQNSDGTWSYTPPVKGSAAGSNPGPKPKKGSRSYHTHGSDLPEYDEERFSDADKGFASGNGGVAYLGTPKNYVKKYIAPKRNGDVGRVEIIKKPPKPKPKPKRKGS